jgi:hypothetical protein
VTLDIVMRGILERACMRAGTMTRRIVKHGQLSYISKAGGKDPRNDTYGFTLMSLHGRSPELIRQQAKDSKASHTEQGTAATDGFLRF